MMVTVCDRCGVVHVQAFARACARRGRVRGVNARCTVTARDVKEIFAATEP